LERKEDLLDKAFGQRKSAFIASGDIKLTNQGTSFLLAYGDSSPSRVIWGGSFSGKCWSEPTDQTISKIGRLP
jgi:hypothetical protein